MMLKVYRTILLLNYLGTVVGKVVANLLSEAVERQALLNDGQSCSRKRRSAIDLAAIMIDRAHKAWLYRTVVGTHLIDITAAFPSVATRRPVNAMTGKHMDGDLKQWRLNFHSERTMATVIGGKAMV
jgi:hypothetical protein